MVELDETVTHVYTVCLNTRRGCGVSEAMCFCFFGGTSVNLFLNADIRTVGHFVSFCVSVVSDWLKQDNVSPKDEE